MAVKYYCRKCGKRFVDWGAEKHGFKCPDCEGEELTRVGLSEEKAVRKPTLRRKPARRPVPVLSTSDDEILVPDIEELEAEGVVVDVEKDGRVFLATEDDEAPEALELDEVLPAGEVAQDDVALDTDDGVFAEATPALDDGTLDETVVEPDEWSK